MLSILLPILFISILWHFVYEAIIAPSLRLSLKFDYDKLKDELWMLRYENHVELNNEVFQLLESKIEGGIDSLGSLNIVSAARIYYSSKNDATAEKEIQKRNQLIKSCKLDLSELERNIIRNFGKSIAINSGALALYLIPFIVLYKLIEAIGTFFIKIKENLKQVRTEIKKAVETIVYTNLNTGFKNHGFHSIINQRQHRHHQHA